MNSWYVIHPESCNRISKPALYSVSDNACPGDDAISLASFLSARFRESRVVILAWYGCVSVSH